MEDALDTFEGTRDKDKLAEVTTRMKLIGPKLKELCMMPECKTPQNAPHLIRALLSAPHCPKSARPEQRHEGSCGKDQAAIFGWWPRPRSDVREASLGICLRPSHGFC